MTKNQTAEDIRSLKFVETVRPLVNGRFVLKTRPNMLSTYVTHKIIRVDANDNDTRCGGALTEPIRVFLPQYHIELSQYGFNVRLVKKPKPNMERFGLTPQYHLGRNMKEWRSRYEPCYGNGSRNSDTQYLYQTETNWKKKALIAVEFLQSAIPHYGERPHWTAQFAYRLGLIGDEILEENN